MYNLLVQYIYYLGICLTKLSIGDETVEGEADATNEGGGREISTMEAEER